MGIVVGSGLAGLTVALRLAERGYRVKVYEQKSILGGNPASRPAANGTCSIEESNTARGDVTLSRRSLGPIPGRQ